MRGEIRPDMSCGPGNEHAAGGCGAMAGGNAIQCERLRHDLQKIVRADAFEKGESKGFEQRDNRFRRDAPIQPGLIFPERRFRQTLI